ncbi:MAG: putative alkyl quinolone biosynthesis protein PqsB [Cognaticolwellia sp.]|jgi:putative alkyl quinolone biosynthesis protein PqsB
MRILAAKTWFPECTQGDPSLAYGAARPMAEAGSYALKYLVPCVDSILQQQQITAGDIDLIVSLSMSADHLVEELEIMGPRVGHPLQKSIGADNAFVFDLMDSSLSKAFYVINALAIAEEYKNILIIRSEIGLSSKTDLNSGFCLPDGVMAILAEVNSLQVFKNQNLPGNWWPLSLELETNIRSTEQEKVKFNYPVQQGLTEAINQQSDKLLSNPNFAMLPFAIESWLEPSSGETSCYGPFELVRQIEKRLNESNETTFVAISFDPFGPSVEAVTLELGRGNIDE